MMLEKKLPYISLFSGGGLGDTGFEKAGLYPVILNELDEYRAQITSTNFPNSKVIQGDIKDKLDEIEFYTKAYLEKTNTKELFMISATPPCQGMSKNGIGSILKAMNEGKRPKLDERNILFTYAIELVKRLQPRFLFFENVDRMVNTYYMDSNGDQIQMIDYFITNMENLGYHGKFQVVNFADYGLPQNRRRLLGVFCRSDLNINNDDLIPKTTHSTVETITHKKHISLRDAIGNLPLLDSKDPYVSKSSFHPLHKTSVSRPDLYYWISNTKEGDTAFNNNKCPDCGFVSKKEDIYCIQCSTLLPKPVVEKDGELRIIKAFISAYKRMKYDAPSPTITTRSAYAGSDNNIHPEQNRVLSLYEVAILQGLNPNTFKLGPIRKIRNGKEIIEEIGNTTLLRDVLGEPVSPLISNIIAKNIINLNDSTLVTN